MSGKLCNGTGTDQPYLRESKGYCEGRAAAAAGVLKAANPAAAGRDEDMWDAGWDSWTDDPGAVTQDCCALPPGGGYTP